MNLPLGIIRTFLTGAVALLLGTAQAEVTLLNVPYDVTRELCKEINPAFIEHWKQTPVTIVDRVVERKGTRKQAQGYLEFLYSPQGQEIIARHFFRPRLEAVLQKYAQQFKPIQLFTVDEVFGGWVKAQQTHFADGGMFDQIVVNRS